MKTHNPISISKTRAQVTLSIICIIKTKVLEQVFGSVPQMKGDFLKFYSEIAILDNFR